MSRNYISHYGVPGMKWRFTKYTNKIRKGGRDIYEYFTKEKVTKGDIRRAQKQQGMVQKHFKGTGKPGVYAYTGNSINVKGRTQFQRDLGKARRRWNKFTSNVANSTLARRAKLYGGRAKLNLATALNKYKYRAGKAAETIARRAKFYGGRAKLNLATALNKLKYRAGKASSLAGHYAKAQLSPSALASKAGRAASNAYMNYKTSTHAGNQSYAAKDVLSKAKGNARKFKKKYGR